MPRIGRNDRCPCGSGLKFKKCHGRTQLTSSAEDYRHILDRHAADERVRQIQQGLGKPIIATRMDDHQIVVVGNTIHWSTKWKTFPDFLGDYIKRKVGGDWGNSELAKPLPERHPLLQWYDAYCRYQASTITTAGEVHSADVTGIVACYLGTAYALYLLDHNVELQERLLKRLRDPGNFQGAYYELIVASILIRAGFTLILEDETDRATKHCEFAAVSSHSGKRYWVEAKMRSVEGFLGRTQADGGPDDKSLSRLINHLSAALRKPAEDERLIFIDINAHADGTEGMPDWIEPAIARLEKYERMNPESKAYVVVTNMAFHRQLDSVPSFAAVPFGLGMADFNRRGMLRISDSYRRKQKHIDAHAIVQAGNDYLRFPTTFDGRLPSEALADSTSRVAIGETYFFPDASEGGLTGRVTTATVDETRKEALVGVTDIHGRAHVLRVPMSDTDFSEYLQFRDAYFGRIEPGPTKIENELDLFEWFMIAQNGMPRENILNWFQDSPNLSDLRALNDDDLLIAYCEALVGAAVKRNG